MNTIQSIKGSSSEIGVFGISNSTGKYTYYENLTLAMNAAVSGCTIEVFGDVIETGDIEVTLKSGVTINGNGHTYTLDNPKNIHALKAEEFVSTSCSILNLNVIRSGSLPTNVDNSCLFLDTGGEGVINCSGSRFRNLGFGSAIFFNFDSRHEINHAEAHGSGMHGAIAIFSDARLNNSIGYGTSGECGIRCYNGGSLQNCIGISDSGMGIYGGSGTLSNCVGISIIGTGFLGGAQTVNCIGRSISGIGFEASFSPSNTVNCTGISVSGHGFYSNGSSYNCTGISSSSAGVRLTNIGRTHNITAKSSSSHALLSNSRSNELFGGTIICDWNNPEGYGIKGVSGVITGVIVNCIFTLSNALAPYLFNNGIASAIKLRGNTYTGGGIFNNNLTNSTSGIEDSKGNIYI